MREWIVITDRGTYECHRCGDVTKAPLERMPFEMMIGMMDGYVEAHKDCPDPEGDSLVGRSFHMCQSVEGPLANWKLPEWKKQAKAWWRKDGTVPTGPELKRYFIEKLGDGWRVLPIGDCDNFDKVKGCLGHKAGKNG